MSEQCKHEWRLWKNAGTVCVKCNMNAINIVAALEAQLAAKERQLEAAAREMSYLQGECPYATYEEPLDGCEGCDGKKSFRACWRRRWEDASK